LVLAVGAGPTEVILGSIFRIDHPEPLPEPKLAVFMEGGKVLTPQQKAAYERAVDRIRARNREREAIQKALKDLLDLLDLRGAALLWQGWTPEPPPDPGRSPRRYGGFADPGQTPALALALPVKAGQADRVSAALANLMPRLFKGCLRKRSVGTVQLTRIETGQSFTPCHAVVADHVVLGSHDGAVERVVAGLLGQTPTLADVPGKTYGRVEWDGPALAREIAALLKAYPTLSEAERDLLFGPFLGALKGLGRRLGDLTSTEAGFELTLP